ncbi:MAG: DUF484 family protein, partial [Gammaproteobacteria bacterium]
QHFNADRVAVLVFAGPSFVEADGPQEFIGMQDARATTFAEFVDNGQAQCGQLAVNLKDALWPDMKALDGSFALLPLSANTWRGVIAIQSDDSSRFSAEMGTEFLSYISDIVCLIVDPWVARE